MKIVVCPDSFKGSLSSSEAADAIERGALRALGRSGVEIVKIPLADGGEGTMDALVRATGGSLRRVRVKDPLLRETDACFGVLGYGAAAVVEMAAASGLCLLAEPERNPLVTSTYGAGQLLLQALEAGVSRVMVGIGGSATNDAGAGAMTALGARFLGANGAELPPGGAALVDLDRIDMSGFVFPVDRVQVEVACDVTNPLYGPNGAAAVFGPQKGADTAMVTVLDAALRRFAEVVKRDLGADVADMPGAGAAGGLGAALAAFLHAELRSGIDIVLDAVGFDAAIAGADLIITGEGRIDAQTAFGKAISGVLKRAKPVGVPVVALAGSVAEDIQPLYAAGLTSAFSIAPGPVDVATSTSRAAEFLELAAERVARLRLRE